jgi:hypothetical protein
MKSSSLSNVEYGQNWPSLQTKVSAIRCSRLSVSEICLVLLIVRWHLEYLKHVHVGQEYSGASASF